MEVHRSKRLGLTTSVERGDVMSPLFFSARAGGEELTQRAWHFTEASARFFAERGY